PQRPPRFPYTTLFRSGFLAGILNLIDRTELNAVVVDVKDDSGRVTIATDEATAVAAGAVRPFLTDPQAFTADLHERGIYAIARRSEEHTSELQSRENL